MKSIISILIALCISGCSSICSNFDGVELLWPRKGLEIEDLKTPNGFSVTAQEVCRKIPPTKILHKVYYDQKNYYIIKCDRFIVNSYVAKKSGIIVDGNDKSTLERLTKPLSLEELNK